MLVLALQFSRSDADQQHRRAVARGRLLWRREDSLKTEEKTVPPFTRRTGEGPNPSTRATRRSTTHQCTNRCVSNRVERVSTCG